MILSSKPNIKLIEEDDISYNSEDIIMEDF